MSFHIMTTAYQPEKLSELQTLFDNIVSQPWFSPDAKVSVGNAGYFKRSSSGSGGI